MPPEPYPPNLVVNADDFGLDPRISLAIARCVREGLVHSLSAVPFRDAFHIRLLRELLRDRPEVKVGVHLCLVEFPYLTLPKPGSASDLPPTDFPAHGPSPSGHTRPHLSAPGVLPPAGFRRFLIPYLRGKVDPEWVQREWAAQIEIVAAHLDGKVPLAHLDSHQNLHVLPGLWPIARALQRRFGIPRLRVPYDPSVRSMFRRFPFGMGMQLLARTRRRPESPVTIGVATSTAFTVEANRHLLDKVDVNPETQYEVMVHPALSEDDEEILSAAAEMRPPPDETGTPGSGKPDAAARPCIPGITSPFRTRIRSTQVRELEELLRLREYFAARRRRSASASRLLP